MITFHLCANPEILARLWEELDEAAPVRSGIGKISFLGRRAYGGYTSFVWRHYPTAEIRTGLQHRIEIG